MKEKEYFILTFDNGRKNFVGNKKEAAFFYINQEEISVMPCYDSLTGNVEMSVFDSKGDFLCSFESNTLNEFYRKFFDKYIALHETVQRENGLTEAVKDDALVSAVRNVVKLNELKKAFYNRLKKISETHGYNIGKESA